MSHRLPLLTIGIPTYNRSTFLRESLAAALAQTHPEMEIIVSDNASPDDTRAVVNELGRGKVTYHRHDSNLGPTANFLKCLDLANGKYFAWLQDDDLVFHD